MTDIKVTELTPVSGVTVTDLFVVRDSAAGVDKSATGQQVKDMAVTSGSTSAEGVLQLYNGVDSTSTSLAATANAVKVAKDRADVAKSTADAATSSIAGKANISHTHSASDITSGTMSYQRLPKSDLNNHGIARATTNLTGAHNGNENATTANGYFPSIEAVNIIKNQVNINTAAISDLDTGNLPYTPLPLTTPPSTNRTDFPIGTTIVINAVFGTFGSRGQVVYPSLSKTTEVGTGYIAMYTAQGVTGLSGVSYLAGVWHQRGCTGEYTEVSIAPPSTGKMVSFLAQRVS